MTPFSDYKALGECIWEKPKHYGGHNPVGEAVIATRNRDSSLIDESNWDAMLKIAEHGSDNDHVYIFRARHWAVGWVEYLMLKPDAPDDLKQRIDEALCALADYPILDEEDYSRREWEAMEDFWGKDDVAKRLDNIQSFNRYHGRGRPVPIMAARHDLSHISCNYQDLYEHIREVVQE